MTLREAVKTYLRLAGSYGKPVPLASFGLPRQETERIFSIFDEDYHISRFFHFSDQRPATGEPSAATAVPGVEAYEINGFAHTHLSIDAEIQSIL